MTDRGDRTPIDRVFSTLAEEGFDGMAEAIAVLMNEAMKLERSAFLGASPHERSSERRGHANGYKPKKVKTRVGVVDLQVPRRVEAGGSGTSPLAAPGLARGTQSAENPGMGPYGASGGVKCHRLPRSGGAHGRVASGTPPLHSLGCFSGIRLEAASSW